jgi:hypothetical protein
MCGETLKSRKREGVTKKQKRARKETDDTLNDAG